MANKFTFNGKSSEDFGIGISGSGTYNKPRRRVEHYSVPGRNGELSVTDDTFENVTVYYDCYAYLDFPDKIDALAAWLLSAAGYQRLEDTYHPEVYRMAEFIGPIDPEPTTLNRSGTFRLEFNCKPEQFFKSGEFFHSFKGKTKIFNPTSFIAKPLIRLKGASMTSLTTYGYRNRNKVLSNVDIKGYASSDFIYLDCESWEAYYYDEQGEKVNANYGVELFQHRYPVLYPGENSFYWRTDPFDQTSQISDRDIDIQGRWWTI